MGATGAQGVAGPAGPQGPQGTVGATCSAMGAWPQGATGATGATGPPRAGRDWPALALCHGAGVQRVGGRLDLLQHGEHCVLRLQRDGVAIARRRDPDSGGGTGSCSTGSQTFNYTGANQTFMLPAGCTTFTVKLWGAGGGGGAVMPGGAGGYTVGSFSSMTSGTTFGIVVGGAGTFSGFSTTYGGGGAGSTNSGNTGASGGGRAAITFGGADLLTAGGGGGGNGGSGYTTGAGGGLIGGSANGLNSTDGGNGGTQSAGGASGSFNPSGAAASTSAARPTRTAAAAAACAIGGGWPWRRRRWGAGRTSWAVPEERAAADPRRPRATERCWVARASPATRPAWASVKPQRQRRRRPGSSSPIRDHPHLLPATLSLHESWPPRPAGQVMRSSAEVRGTLGGMDGSSRAAARQRSGTKQDGPPGWRGPRVLRRLLLAIAVASPACSPDRRRAEVEVAPAVEGARVPARRLPDAARCASLKGRYAEARSGSDRCERDDDCALEPRGRFYTELDGCFRVKSRGFDGAAADRLGEAWLDAGCASAFARCPASTPAAVCPRRRLSGETAPADPRGLGARRRRGDAQPVVSRRRSPRCRSCDPAETAPPCARFTARASMSAWSMATSLPSSPSPRRT